MSIQDIKVVSVSKSQFVEVYYHARLSSELIANATSPASEVADGTSEADQFYLDNAGRYGFIVKADGELIAVFSMLRGIGSKLVQLAIEKGAKRLDCFDGYLVGFYQRNGFMEVARVANWTEGEPDIVFMERIF